MIKFSNHKEDIQLISQTADVPLQIPRIIVCEFLVLSIRKEIDLFRYARKI